MPIPLPSLFVVQNGSNICDNRAAGMPGLASETASRTMPSFYVMGTRTRRRSAANEATASMAFMLVTFPGRVPRHVVAGVRQIPLHINHAPDNAPKTAATS